MISNRIGQRRLIAIAMSMAVGVAIAEECEIRPVAEKTDEYAVYDSNGHYKGYVALEGDGSWFAWVESQGAQNETFDTREKASDVVCSSK